MACWLGFFLIVIVRECNRESRHSLPLRAVQNSYIYRVGFTLSEKKKILESACLIGTFTCLSGHYASLSLFETQVGTLGLMILDTLTRWYVRNARAKKLPYKSSRSIHHPKKCQMLAWFSLA